MADITVLISKEDKLWRARNAARRTWSFTPQMPVLICDGTLKPIAEVVEGDWVLT